MITGVISMFFRPYHYIIVVRLPFFPSSLTATFSVHTSFAKQYLPIYCSGKARGFRVFFLNHIHLVPSVLYTFSNCNDGELSSRRILTTTQRCLKILLERFVFGVPDLVHEILCVFLENGYIIVDESLCVLRFRFDLAFIAGCASPVRRVAVLLLCLLVCRNICRTSVDVGEDVGTIQRSSEEQSPGPGTL